VGVDLTLLPALHETDTGDLVCPIAFDLDLRAVIDPFLGIERHRPAGRVFWPIEKIPDGEVSLWESWRDAPYVGGLLQYSMFGWATEDLRYVLAGDIRTAFAGLADVLSEVNDFERAAIAYVSALEPQTKVVLYSW
jgi:hypothetical protein